MYSNPNELIGTVFEDAYCFGLLNEDDRSDWLTNDTLLGRETADDKIILDNLDIIDLEADGTPWSMWVVVRYNPEMQAFYLLPWTCDEESYLVQESNNIDSIYMAKKYKAKFLMHPDSLHDIYLLQGYPIIISEKEMQEMHNKFYVARAIINDLKDLKIGGVYVPQE